MTPFVVDASVVIKWVFPEVHGEAALRLFYEAKEFLAPDFLFAETTNAILMKVRRREIPPEEGLLLIADIDRLVIEPVSCRDLVAEAYRIATAHGRSIYDALYVALAIQRKTRLITADDRLYNALSSAPAIAPHIQSLRDY